MNDTLTEVELKQFSQLVYLNILEWQGVDTKLFDVYRKVENIMERVVSFCNQSVEFVTNMVTEAVRVTNLIGDRIAEFSQKVKHAVSDFMTKLKDGFNRFVDNTIQ